MIGIDLISTDLKQITFTDVVEFCGRKEKEGIQFDYKKELSSLAKDFSAFSNTRGGVILVGVDEHKEFGYPIAWDGVDNDKQLLEKIDQWATTVQPLPRYTYHMTDVVDGKVFILVKILEGDKPPYYVNNDSHLWVRTGVISNPIDMAKPDYVELLYNKRKDAEKLRQINIDVANSIFDSYLRQCERERLSEINQEKQKYQQKYQEDNSIGIYKQTVYGKKLGEDGGLTKICFQPYYPTNELMKPDDILEKIVEIRNGDGKFSPTFPTPDKRPIPNGVASFNWNRLGGDIGCEQLNANGLVYYAWELMRRDTQTGIGCIYLSHVASYLFHIMRGMVSFYKMASFNGTIIGKITISSVEGVEINQEMGSGHFGFNSNIKGLQDSYNYDFELDTDILFNELKFQTYFIEMIQKIYWSFGYKISDGLVKAYLKMQGWLVEEAIENVT